MGLVLLLVGFVLWITHTAPFIGVVFMIIGAILFFVPAAPYGYSSWRGRRGPPPY